MDKAASDLFSLVYPHSVDSCLSSIGTFTMISGGFSSVNTQISAGSGQV